MIKYVLILLIFFVWWILKFFLVKNGEKQQSNQSYWSDHCHKDYNSYDKQEKYNVKVPSLDKIARYDDSVLDSMGNEPKYNGTYENEDKRPFDCNTFENFHQTLPNNPEDTRKNRRIDLRGNNNLDGIASYDDKVETIERSDGCSAKNFERRGSNTHSNEKESKYEHQASRENVLFNDQSDATVKKTNENLSTRDFGTQTDDLQFEEKIEDNYSEVNTQERGTQTDDLQLEEENDEKTKKEWENQQKSKNSKFLDEKQLKDKVNSMIKERERVPEQVNLSESLHNRNDNQEMLECFPKNSTSTINGHIKNTLDRRNEQRDLKNIQKSSNSMEYGGSVDFAGTEAKESTANVQNSVENRSDEEKSQQNFFQNADKTENSLNRQISSANSSNLFDSNKTAELDQENHKTSKKSDLTNSTEIGVDQAAKTPSFPTSNAEFYPNTDKDISIRLSTSLREKSGSKKSKVSKNPETAKVGECKETVSEYSTPIIQTTEVSNENTLISQSSNGLNAADIKSLNNLMNQEMGIPEKDATLKTFDDNVKLKVHQSASGLNSLQQKMAISSCLLNKKINKSDVNQAVSIRDIEQFQPTNDSIFTENITTSKVSIGQEVENTEKDSLLKNFNQNNSNILQVGQRQKAMDKMNGKKLKKARKLNKKHFGPRNSEKTPRSGTGDSDKKRLKSKKATRAAYLYNEKDQGVKLDENMPTPREESTAQSTEIPEQSQNTNSSHLKDTVCSVQEPDSFLKIENVTERNMENLTSSSDSENEIFYDCKESLSDSNEKIERKQDKLPFSSDFENGIFYDCKESLSDSNEKIESKQDELPSLSDSENETFYDCVQYLEDLDGEEEKEFEAVENEFSGPKHAQYTPSSVSTHKENQVKDKSVEKRDELSKEIEIFSEDTPHVSENVKSTSQTAIVFDRSKPCLHQDGSLAIQISDRRAQEKVTGELGNEIEQNGTIGDENSKDTQKSSIKPDEFSMKNTAQNLKNSDSDVKTDISEELQAQTDKTEIESHKDTILSQSNGKFTTSTTQNDVDDLISAQGQSEIETKVNADQKEPHILKNPESHLVQSNDLKDTEEASEFEDKIEGNSAIKKQDISVSDESVSGLPRLCSKNAQKIGEFEEVIELDLNLEEERENTPLTDQKLISIASETSPSQKIQHSTDVTTAKTLNKPDSEELQDRIICNKQKSQNLVAERESLNILTQPNESMSVTSSPQMGATEQRNEFSEIDTTLSESGVSVIPDGLKDIEKKQNDEIERLGEKKEDEELRDVAAAKKDIGAVLDDERGAVGSGSDIVEGIEICDVSKEIPITEEKSFPTETQKQVNVDKEIEKSSTNSTLNLAVDPKEFENELEKEEFSQEQEVLDAFIEEKNAKTADETENIDRIQEKSTKIKNSADTQKLNSEQDPEGKTSFLDKKQTIGSNEQDQNLSGKENFHRDVGLSQVSDLYKEDQAQDDLILQDKTRAEKELMFSLLNQEESSESSKITHQKGEENKIQSLGVSESFSVQKSDTAGVSIEKRPVEKLNAVDENVSAKIENTTEDHASIIELEDNEQNTCDNSQLLDQFSKENNPTEDSASSKDSERDQTQDTESTAMKDHAELEIYFEKEETPVNDQLSSEKELKFSRGSYELEFNFEREKDSVSDVLREEKAEDLTSTIEFGDEMGVTRAEHTKKSLIQICEQQGHSEDAGEIETTKDLTREKLIHSELEKQKDEAKDTKAPSVDSVNSYEKQENCSTHSESDEYRAEKIGETDELKEKNENHPEQMTNFTNDIALEDVKIVEDDEHLDTAKSSEKISEDVGVLDQKNEEVKESDSFIDQMSDQTFKELIGTQANIVVEQFKAYDRKNEEFKESDSLLDQMSEQTFEELIGTQANIVVEQLKAYGQKNRSNFVDDPRVNDKTSEFLQQAETLNQIDTKEVDVEISAFDLQNKNSRAYNSSTLLDSFEEYQKKLELVPNVGILKSNTANGKITDAKNTKIAKRVRFREPIAEFQRVGKSQASVCTN